MITSLKLNKGITLIEIMVALSLLTFILLAGGGIYISGWNMFRDAQFVAQTHRNAVLPMAHMVKRLQGATSFASVAGPPLELRYTINPLGTPTTRRYIFNRNNSNRIEHDNDTNNVNGYGQIIGTRIRFDGTNPTTFTISHAGIVVAITITSEDNRGQNLNLYTIQSRVEARYGATPPV